MTDLFIGVVSHEGSRFALNQGENGLGASLGRALSLLGVSSQVEINLRDAWDPSVLTLNLDEAHSSQRASLKFERTWLEYLSEGTSGPQRIRLAKRIEFIARGWLMVARFRRFSSQEPSLRALRRLINIELSHLHLWKSALKSGASWTLIIEDDGGCSDIEDLAFGIRDLIQQIPHSNPSRLRPQYINISSSFSADELGVSGLLRTTNHIWMGSRPRIIQESLRPITNTVCAILYRRELLESVVGEFAQMPFSPVVPIDFKLNQALMNLYKSGQLSDGACWQVEPAPIVQMSMHQMG